MSVFQHLCSTQSLWSHTPVCTHKCAWCLLPISARHVSCGLFRPDPQITPLAPAKFNRLTPPPQLIRLGPQWANEAQLDHPEAQQPFRLGSSPPGQKPLCSRPLTIYASSQPPSGYPPPGIGWDHINIQFVELDSLRPLLSRTIQKDREKQSNPQPVKLWAGQSNHKLLYRLQRS